MSRWRCKLALFLSVALAGCSAAEQADDDEAVDSSWRGDPGVPIAGDGSESAGGKADGPCPSGVICVDSLPFVDHNDTSGASAVLDGYGCEPDANESGPERVYRVDVPKTGLLVASLDGLGSGVDVDVHILQQLSASSCIDRGHWDAAALLAPGRFWIVVDSWVDDDAVAHAGRYELTLTLNTTRDHISEGLDPDVLEAGLRGFARAWAAGTTTELEYGILDYGMPSTKPRLFVLDLRRGETLYRELAAHGAGSQDANDATRTGSVSNVDGSHASSVGMVRTAETYSGSNGYSLRLDGLEPGYNNHDRSRAIVMHGADYATQSFVDANGYLGRSWGCPAVDPAVNSELIGTLKGGRLLLKYFGLASWLSSSSYVAP